MSKVTIKGIKDGLLVTVEAGNWPEVKVDLLDEIHQRADFIKGAKITLDVGEHELRAAEMEKLRDKFADIDVILFGVVSKSTITETSAQSLGLATLISKPAARAPENNNASPHGGEEALFVEKTLRSGSKIEFPGHVTIFGDINPGAEIVAGGNVIIWGNLRGIVHAGASGDESAKVCALGMKPMQLRIAGTVAITPPQTGKTQPEVATLQNGRVVATPWDIKE